MSNLTVKFHDTPRTRDQNVTFLETYRGDRVGECHVPLRRVRKNRGLGTSCAAYQGAHFSKAPETFWARKAKAKSRTLRFQSCFIHIFLI